MTIYRMMNNILVLVIFIEREENSLEHNDDERENT
jgi:hypothetical protein